MMRNLNVSYPFLVLFYGQLRAQTVYIFLLAGAPVFLLAEAVGLGGRDRLFLNKNSSVLWPEISQHF